MSKPLQISDLPLAEQMFLGLDLGVQQDFTALVFAEYHPRYLVKRALEEIDDKLGVVPDEDAELLFPEYRVRVLPRWPLGTPLPQIAKGLRRMLRSPGLRERDVSLAVDTTGPGEGARDTLERFGLYGKNVIITGGASESVKEGKDRRLRYHVAKDLLVSPLRAMSEPGNRRLHILDSTDEARTLIGELKSFKPSASMRHVGASSTEADIIWREKEHDDLVLACALAIWISKKVPQGDVDEALAFSEDPLSDSDLFRLDDSFR
jgi:hypothetical protein